LADVRVGQGQGFGFDPLISDQQQVDIEGAGTVDRATSSSGPGLEPLGPREESEWRERTAHLDHCVEKIGLGNLRVGLGTKQGADSQGSELPGESEDGASQLSRGIVEIRP
jgi:hypothetical protein